MAKPLFNVTDAHHGNLIELIDVPADGTTSKALIDTGDVKQILFAMDAGQDISEHRAPYVATVQVLTGRLDFRVADEQRTMGPHDWVVMPPNAPHDLAAPEPCRFLLTLVKTQ